MPVPPPPPPSIHNTLIALLDQVYRCCPAAPPILIRYKHTGHTPMCRLRSVGMVIYDTAPVCVGIGTFSHVRTTNGNDRYNVHAKVVKRGWILIFEEKGVGLKFPKLVPREERKQSWDGNFPVKLNGKRELSRFWKSCSATCNEHM